MTAPATTQEPTRAEINELAHVLTEADMKGIRHGHWTLARYILAAGYRRMPEPEPVRYGECRACEQTQPLTAEGMVVEHDDDRRGGMCIGARVTPFRIVDPPEDGTDG